MWKDIRGYPNYLISDDGLVRNRKGRTLKQFKDKNGYLRVCLCKDAKQKTFSAHRLVAIAFVKNPDGLKTVDHINGIKTDNRACNLQWMSAEDNLNKYLREANKCRNKQPRYGGRKRGETQRIKVNQYTRSGELLNTFISFMEAERKTGIQSGNISLCVNGHKPSAGGYVWRKAQ